MPVKKSKASSSSKMKSKTKGAPKSAPKKPAAKKKLTAKASSATKPTQSVKSTAKPVKSTVAPEAKLNPAAQAQADAVQTALATSKKLRETEPKDEDEFDPEAFFAASGGTGLFKAHVMRKERVDVNLDIRYRIMDKGPLVHHSELLNLSKTGLCLKTKDIVKNKTILRIEIPLPHTAELFSIQAEAVWSMKMKGPEYGNSIHTGLYFLPMNQAKQAVINNFIQQRRDEIIMAKIGLDKFTDVVPVAGLD